MTAAHPKLILLAICLVALMSTAGVAMPYPILAPIFVDAPADGFNHFAGLPPKLLLGIALAANPLGRFIDANPALLELEITESLLMKDVESAIATMHELKAIGVRLSIDDFGTGYSSLNYLKRFPIDQLKIDKSFLREIETSRDDLAITLAMIAMAHGMGLTVIAEGVENEVQLAFLRANDCDEIQGYHIGRPVPAHEIAALLQKAPG